jgi:carbon storage regulator
MLILSRREKQRIKLGPDIILTVIRVSGDKVRLGIEAPSDMIVLRDELEVYSPEERAAVNAASAALPHAA